MDAPLQQVRVARTRTRGAASLAGKITTVDPSPDWPGRYIVRFAECACLDPQPIVWRGAQNPVRYVNDISTLGVEPGLLDWRVVLNAATPGGGQKEAPHDPRSSSRRGGC